MKNAIQSRLGFTSALVTPQCLCAGYSAQKQSGFTLIELLVVVLIIGILAAVALPQYQNAVEKSRAAEAFSNIASFAKALEVWKLANPGHDHRTFTGQGYGVGQLDIDVPADWVQATETMLISTGLPGSKSCSKNFCYDINAGDDVIKAYRANSSTYKYGIWYDINNHYYFCKAFTAADLKLCNSLSNMHHVHSSL